MNFDTATRRCHVRSSIYRASDPTTKYAKNHTIPFDHRVPIADQLATDWEEWDPNEEYNLSLPADS